MASSITALMAIMIGKTINYRKTWGETGRFSTFNPDIIEKHVSVGRLVAEGGQNDTEMY